ncbi:MAG: trypsin-like serine protease [Cyanobacteriota bacterium]
MPYPSWLFSSQKSSGWQILLGLSLTLMVSACGGRGGSSSVPPVPAPSVGRIEGSHFDDLNGNGLWDPGEPGLFGMTTFLDLNGNGRLDPEEPSLTSDASGNFRFFDLLPGTYRVTAILPPERIFTTPRSGLGLGRIVGGSNVPTGAFPWIVALVLANELDPFQGQFCAGSLITPEWVITAAHCFFSNQGQQVVNAQNLDLLLGTNRLAVGSGQRIRAAQIVINPDYNPQLAEPGGNDIALVRLSQPVSLATLPLVQPNQLNLTAPGTTATIIGWGATQQRAPDQEPSGFSRDLQQASVPIVSNAECNAPRSYNGTILDSMLCAGFPQGGVDSCQADSGGPLVVPNENGFVLAGITSFGLGCALPNFFGIYTRVSSFLDFVQSVIGSTPTPSPTPTSAPTAGATASFTVNLTRGEVVAGLNFGSRAR